MNTDLLIEETMDNQERLEKMLSLNKKIENISKQMNLDYVYNVESNVYHDYDGDVLNFALVA
jgi:Skp family chaperone for outer membrane proteins